MLLKHLLRTERLGARLIPLKYQKACHLVGLRILYLHGEEVRLVVENIGRCGDGSSLLYTPQNS